MWSLLLGILLLGGALAPGYVLSYDMVWVPDLALTAEAWGTGSALPRAVPSDAVVAVLDEIVPGALLQKVVLLGSLVVAGAGASALVDGASVAVRLVAASLMVWNPFVVERLVIGHWPVLLGYAVLPWVLVVCRRWSPQSRVWPPGSLPVLLVGGSLSASTGVATGVAALAGGWRRGRTGSNLVLVAMVVAANSPWLVAGLLHSADATSASQAARLFATSDEGLLPGPLAAITLGGIWNAEVVPGTRLGFLAVVGLVLMAALAAFGWAAHRRTPIKGASSLVVCWVVGVGVAVVSWAAPDAIGWLAATLPGGGLLRDGARLLALAAPLTVVLVARGAEALLALAPDRATRVLVAGLLTATPVALLPDAALGSAGRLQAVHYPSVLSDVRAAVQAAPAGDVVVLPFASYRAPEWNGRHKVLDPLPRFLGRAAVINDVLYVDGMPLPGEDPRAASVAEALSRPTAGSRAAALGELGVSVVVSERLPGLASPAVAGRTTFDQGDFLVVEIEQDVRVDAEPSSWVAAMGVAWTVWLALLVSGTSARAVMLFRKNRNTAQ
ncbi:hypothetical protein [Nocardioides piscis]|uniref:YfhO family protein n=1 Tax=Nocardioides piscis TaxID=2714938 RepID=A0A6G7YHN7_9ACTN|nr:hypothetical protein [Nocardioides piscis]QIK76290.1 hypothetical protein G7071_13515 [Nocardioides piscis]